MEILQNSPEFESLATNLGLSPLQARVLISIFQSGGQATAPQLVKTLSSSGRISRASVYNVLSSLEDRGLLVVSYGINKQKTFALPTTDPNQLLDLIIAPQKNARTGFLSLLKSLQAEKTKSVHQMGRFFTLQGIDSLLNQARLLIQGARTHLVMFANLPFIKLMFDEILFFKKNSPQASLFIQIIGNPLKEMMKEEEKEYELIREKIGRDDVLPPVDFVSELQEQISRLLPERINILNDDAQEAGSNVDSSIIALPETLFKHTAATIMISDEGLLIVWGNKQIPGLNLGVFSRDPFISQFLLLLILFVFRQNRAKPIDPSKLERLLDGRIELLVSVLRDFFGPPT